MSRTYDKLIFIQRINESTEEWENAYQVHAYINKNGSNDEYLSAGAIQDKMRKVFEIRYFSALDVIEQNTQSYRILYKGIPYDIKDYDDYRLQHRTVRLLGVSY